MIKTEIKAVIKSAVETVIGDVRVTVNGNGMSFRINPIPVKQGSWISNHIRQRSGFSMPRKPLSLEVRLKKKRNRTITRLATILNSYENTPELFISLIVDRQKYPLESIEEEKRYFINFQRLIKRAYPKCWFIYKIEWSKSAKIHFHLIGSLGIDDKEQLHKKHKTILRQLWNQANDGEKLHYDAYHQCDCIKERHQGYMVAPSKCKTDMRCIKELNGCWMWGVINRDNIEKYTPLDFRLSAIEWVMFKGIISSYLKQNSTSIYYKKCFEWTAGTLNFVPYDEIIEAYIDCKTSTYERLRGYND